MLILIAQIAGQHFSRSICHPIQIDYGLWRHSATECNRTIEIDNQTTANCRWL